MRNKLSAEIEIGFTGYFKKFAETILEKLKGVEVLVEHQTFSFLPIIHCILIFVLSLLVD